MKTRQAARLVLLTTFLLTPFLVARAQISTPRLKSVSVDPYNSLEDQLVNRLRATSVEQRAYLKFLVQQVRDGRLDIKMVVAVERYALRRRQDYPFPFFERAMKVQAQKQGVVLPPVRSFASTRLPTP